MDMMQSVQHWTDAVKYEWRTVSTI